MTPWGRGLGPRLQDLAPTTPRGWRASHALKQVGLPRAEKISNFHAFYMYFWRIFWIFGEFFGELEKIPEKSGELVKFFLGGWRALKWTLQTGWLVCFSGILVYFLAKNLGIGIFLIGALVWPVPYFAHRVIGHKIGCIMMRFHESGVFIHIYESKI